MDYIAGVIIKHGVKGIIIDTNLLILLIVGVYDIGYIEKISRVKNKGYTSEDFKALSNLVACFKTIYITPQILAELSNLSFKEGKKIDCYDEEFEAYVMNVVEIINNSKEDFTTKEDLIKFPYFRKFGFTDMSILSLAQKESLPVITDDLRLHNLFINLGIESLNMDTIRMNFIN